MIHEVRGGGGRKKDTERRGGETWGKFFFNANKRGKRPYALSRRSGRKKKVDVFDEPIGRETAKERFEQTRTTHA